METITITVDDMNYIKNQFQLMAEELEKLTTENDTLKRELENCNTQLEPKPIKEVLGDDVFQHLNNFMFNKD